MLLSLPMALTTLLTMLVTALLSGAVAAVATLGLGYYLVTRVWRRRLEAELDRHLAAAQERLGAEVEKRVAAGVRQGVESLTSAESLRTTTRNVARGGAGLLEDLLLGPRRPRE